ncbi:hypothetical protein F5148DRAFT_1167109, partial [Russula earlei]
MRFEPSVIAAQLFCFPLTTTTTTSHRTSHPHSQVSSRDAAQIAQTFVIPSLCPSTPLPSAHVTPTTTASTRPSFGTLASCSRLPGDGNSFRNGGEI